MDTKCDPGAISYPGGVIPFGVGKPTLCVNDQIGYMYGDPAVLAELQEGNIDSLIKMAKKSVEAGFPVINVQLMEISLDEVSLVPKTVEKLVEATGCCIAVDSRNPKIVDSALKAYPYKAMCNVVNGERENLRSMLPIIAKHGGAIGTALVDEKGIPQTVTERLAVGRKIVGAAESYGIPKEDIMLDATCFPSGVVPDSMRTTLETIKAFHEELGVPTLLGVSNAGYMMPNPRMIDLAYFIATVSWGLDVAMIDPFTPNLAWLSKAIDFLVGIDPYAVQYLKHYREGKKASEVTTSRVCGK
jgi:5-methyltetrahydrofolate--homocysteine methyltransferase